MKTRFFTLFIAICWAITSSGQSATPAGDVVGQLLDAATGSALAGCTLVMTRTGDETAPQLATFADLEGRIRIIQAPVGTYSVRLFKPGYQKVVIEGIEVKAQELTRINYALTESVEAPPEDSPKSEEFDMDVFELEAFVVSAEQMTEKAATFFDLRRSAIGSVDFLSSEDFSKYAVSDLSAAVQKMPGVNVVEGKFAVVRGLSDRFSSTLINGLPVPSSDPLRQGVQLDLFPTSIIESVVAAKSFLPHMPGNSSGAAFELGTKQFPEQQEAWLKIGYRFNSNANERFLRDPEHSDMDLLAMGKGERGPFTQKEEGGRRGILQRPFLGEESSPPISLTLGAGLGNTTRLWDRKLGYVFAFSYDASATTESDGTFQEWYGKNNSGAPPGFIAYRGYAFTAGSLYTGELAPSGLQGYTRSVTSVLMGGLASFSYDLDPKGLNRLTAVALISQTSDDTVRRLSEGFLPDGGVAIGVYGGNGPIIGVGGTDQGYYYRELIEYEERSLMVGQLLGEHHLSDFHDIEIDWGFSYARTTSDIPRQIESNYLRFSTDGGATRVVEGFGTESSNEGVGYLLQEISNSIDQDQTGARLDLELPFTFLGGREAQLKIGGFLDLSEREVIGGSQALQASSAAASLRAASPEEYSEALVSLGYITDSFAYFPSEAQVTQDVEAGYLSLKLPLPFDFNLTAGFRVEKIGLSASGSAKLGGGTIGAGGYSLDYLLNTGQNWVYDVLYTNGELIGFEDASNPRGEIDETHIFPGVSLGWEPLSSVTMRIGYSETVARPSFRELSPYFDRDTQTGDLLLGNPNLKLVDVRSWDFRTEYVWDDGGVMAVSLFYKDVWNPIEGILLNGSTNGLTYQSFFNNPARATVKGIELEARHSLGFAATFLEKFSVGINFSRIEAEVAVPEYLTGSYFFLSRYGTTLEIYNATGPYVGVDGPDLGIDEERLPRTRRLYDQPEWTVNADITYENEDWGFSGTLSLYAQSSVLSGVGVGNPKGSGSAVDQFTGAYEELNLSLSKTLPWISDTATLKFAVTNLTDSARTIIYDEDIAYADTYERLSYKRGQTYRLAMEFRY